jgi:hypothetical protein
MHSNSDTSQIKLLRSSPQRQFRRDADLRVRKSRAPTTTSVRAVSGGHASVVLPQIDQ